MTLSLPASLKITLLCIAFAIILATLALLIMAGHHVGNPFLIISVDGKW
jgi:hypothetical protein